MNVYDFDKTIYNGDSTADFYLFALKRHKKIITLAPSLLGSVMRFYVFKKGTKTEFKQVMYRFLRYCDIDRDIADFWAVNRNKIKQYYLKQKREDDVIISASPEFLLEPIINELNIGTLMASKVDKHTGVYDGINCHGKEKVRRFYEAFPGCKIDEFYSDSYSDTPLAEIAEKAYIVKGEDFSEWEFK